MGFIKDAWDSLTGKSAAEASVQASEQAAGAQGEALDYLREREQIPRQFSEGATQQLGGLFGIGDVSRQQADQSIQASPIFQASLGMLPQQEEAILRNQSATGALRSGGTDMMLAENHRQNRLGAYQNTMSGLQGLAGMPSNAGGIAQGMAGIGNTLAQGQIAGAQAHQSGMGNLFGMGLGALAAFSDVRLKENIQPAGERNGFDWYTWEWTEEAGEIGLHGSSEGVLAQDVALTNPDAVSINKGYLTVNYETLGLA